MRGAKHLAGTVIDSSQIVVVGLSLMAALDITIDDQPEARVIPDLDPRGAVPSALASIRLAQGVDPP